MTYQTQMTKDSVQANKSVSLDRSRVFGLNGAGVQPIRDQSN